MGVGTQASLGGQLNSPGQPQEGDRRERRGVQGPVPAGRAGGGVGGGLSLR